MSGRFLTVLNTLLHQLTIKVEENIEELEFSHIFGERCVVTRLSVSKPVRPIAANIQLLRLRPLTTRLTAA